MRKTSQWSAAYCCTIAGVVAVVSGCDSAATDRSGKDKRWAPTAGSPLAESGPKSGAAPSAAMPRIVGNRMVDDVDVEEPDLLSEQTEPSPFRFAEIARRGRHRLRPLLRDDRGQALPHRQRLGRRLLRLRQRRQARRLLRHRDLAPGRVPP